MSWPLKSLDELGTVARGRSRHRPRDAEHLYGGPYPFIQTGDVKHANLYVNSFTQTYSDAGLEQSKLWGPGTLCITIAANIADTAILAIDACFPDSVIGFVADPDKADVRFVKYLFDALLQQRCQRVSQGAAQDNLSQTKLLSLKFPVPKDVKLQCRIADFLSAYDNLIENNQRRIALLEDASKQLYKEWFVRLRFPGHEHTPMDDGCPSGWEWKSLESVCAMPDGIQTGPFGSQLHQSDYTKDGVPVVMPKDIVGFQISTDDVARVPEFIAEKLSRHRMIENDIVYGRRGDIGRRAFISKRRVGWLCGTGCLRIRPNPVLVEPRFLFDNLGSPFTAGTIVNRAKGATMPNLNASVLKSVPVLIPPLSLQLIYADYIQPMVELSETLGEQNRNLQIARNLLLPKLLGGAIALE